MLFTLNVLVAVFVQDIMGYSALRAGVGFIPFVLAVGVGVVASSRLVTRFPPRVVVIGGGILVLGALLYSSTLHGGLPYFPNLVMPLVIAGIGMGVANLPLSLSVIASVGLDRIGPTSAVSLMLSIIGGPVVLAVIQAVVTSRTLSLGGTIGPAKSMNSAQLDALGHGYPMACVAGRGQRPGRWGGPVHRLHRATGGACPGSQESHRRRGTVVVMVNAHNTTRLYRVPSPCSPSVRFSAQAPRGCRRTPVALRSAIFGLSSVCVSGQLD